MTISEAMRRTNSGDYYDNDPLLFADPEVPDIDKLREEFHKSVVNPALAYTKLAQAEDVRYTRWVGQSDDGRRHQYAVKDGRTVRPWDGCADTRVKLVDGAINWIVDLLLAAFWNSRPKASASHASTLTAMQQAEWRKIVSWCVHGPLRGRLIDEVEMAAQIGHLLGSVVLMAEWRREHANVLETLKLDEIVQLAQAAGEQGGPMAQLAQMIVDPTLEDGAVEILTAVFEDLRPARARRVVRELRREGEAQFPIPRVVRNEPVIHTLIPGIDLFLPVETVANLQRARALFRIQWHTIAEIEGFGEDEGWDAKFIEAVKQTAGRRWATPSGMTGTNIPDFNMRLVEIVYAYTRQTDEDGVPGIYRTAFSPHVDGWGQHELVDYGHGEYPFTLYRTEAIDRRPDGARGLSETHSTEQYEIKAQRDNLLNLSELTVLPMFRRRGARSTGSVQEMGPGGILNDPTGSIEAIQMPAGKPDLAFALIEQIWKSTDEYIGRPRPDVNPTPAQLRQQRMVNRWLLTWAEVLWQVGVMAYQYLSPQELEEILGMPPLLTREMLIKHRVVLWFDVRSLDSEWVLQMVQALNQFVLPADAGGAIDRNKYVSFILNYFEPTLAEEVSTDQAGAAQAVFKEVRDEIGAMYQGNEAIYTQNDPAAAMKLQFLQQIVAANPTYQKALPRGKAVVDQKLLEAPDDGQMPAPMREQMAREGRFAFLMQKYAGNLQQSVNQQQNKQTGQLGIQPENPAAG